jgi:hypothetical protein
MFPGSAFVLHAVMRTANGGSVIGTFETITGVGSAYCLAGSRCPHSRVAPQHISLGLEARQHRFGVSSYARELPSAPPSWSRGVLSKALEVPG